MKNTSYKIIIVLLVLAGLLLSFMIFSMVYPFKTVDYLVQPFPILNENKTVRVGEDVMFKVDYCRYTNKPTKVIRSLVNDIIYTLSTSEMSNPVGCNNSVGIVNIPDVVPGIYHIESKATWVINAFRTITKVVETEEFEVIR